MADTVKKSRIVSEEEEDLEEAMLEEFNLRLKNCMSNDNLQIEDSEPPDQLYESIISSPVKTVKPVVIPSPTHEEIPEIPSPLNGMSKKDTIEASNDFIQSEIHAAYEENLYDEPKSILNNGIHNLNGHRNIENLDLVDFAKEKRDILQEEAIYEHIPDKTDPEDQNYVQIDVRQDGDAPETASPIDIRFTAPQYENLEPDNQNSPNFYESIEPKKEKPSFTLPTTSFTDFSDTKSPDSELKTSIKDRMFLCDETSTLLFTQTVTSPMLTPSEENIDFLKGFQQETTNSDSTNSPPKDQGSPDVSEIVEAEEKAETFYENTEFYKNTTPENVYENLRLKDVPEEDLQPEENIYDNLNFDNGTKTQENQEIFENQEIISENIYQNIEEALNEQKNEHCTDRTSIATDASLEEFIRNEKEAFECHLFKEIEENKTNVLDVLENFEEIIGTDLKEETCEDEKENDENKGKDDTLVNIDDIENQEVVEREEIIDVKLRKEENNFKIPNEILDLERNVKEMTRIVEKHQESTENKSVSYKELIYHTKSETSSNYYEKYTESLSKTTQNEVKNREKDTETVPAQIVKNLKSQFVQKLSAGGGDALGNAKKESNAKNEVKKMDIVGHIKKFENKDGGHVNSMENDSTEYSETIEETNNPDEIKIVKKKKVKKTKKEEKENISVTTNEFESEDSFYNVNVKNLCRSFGDLTKIGDLKSDNTQTKRFCDRVRTKSLSDVVAINFNNNIENVFSGVSVRTLKEKFNLVSAVRKAKRGGCPFQSEELKSSFSKFDALQKKNLLHVRSSDSTKAQEKFSNGAQTDVPSCKSCGKQVFQMEQVKAERATWHKNCFRCMECKKQLTVDTYQSNEGSLYCKPHFKALFAPKVVEEEVPPSDKPDLGLEELQSLNVKQRFQVFEHHQSTTETTESERGSTPVNVKRSPSILSKLAKFQKHGMDVGVSNEQLDGIPIEESSSEEEEEEEIPEGEDPDLVRAKRVQKEKPFHFTNMSDVKNKWEQGDQGREERREERKQEIQTIRNRLFMGKQEKMKEAYQQAVMQSESSTNVKKDLSEQFEVCDTKSIKERFEKGDMINEKVNREKNDEEEEVFESEISKKSRSLFLELDASASKAPQISPITPPKVEVKKAREAYITKTSSEDTVKSSTEAVEEVEVKTADIQERFKFFETYKEPEKQRKQFRITPPRDPTQVKSGTPEREIYRDPEVVRSEEIVDDSVIAKETHTASKMLNKFRQMEENLQREPEPQGPKPLKCFTPPPEPARADENTESEYEEEEEEEEEVSEEVDHHGRLPEDVMEAQKAARAKQLRAKFEKWEVQEIKREQQSSVNITEEYTEEQTNIESTRVLRAKFESMRNQSSTESKAPRTKPNRFVDVQNSTENCQGCNGKVYPLEKVSIHGNIYHKSCFRCMECSCVLRMDSYSYNKGLLYCMPHFKRLFISKGDYDSGFGLDQPKEKWNNKHVNMTVA